MSNLGEIGGNLARIESLADGAPDVSVEALGGYNAVQEPPIGVDIHLKSA